MTESLNTLYYTAQIQHSRCPCVALPAKIIRLHRSSRTLGSLFPPADVTKTTDVIKPVENIEDSPVEESLNNTELGLDINPTTSLKPDAEEDDAYTKQLKGTPIVNTPDEAAALYAADATTDSLGKDAPKKTKVTKKAEA